jgi:hypothetical protein
VPVTGRIPVSEYGSDFDSTSEVESVYFFKGLEDVYYLSVRQMLDGREAYSSAQSEEECSAVHKENILGQG